MTRELRIGYVPYGSSFERPGDRLRFWNYASKRQLAFEIAKPSGAYDVVVVTQAADITFWSRYPRGRTKIIFDFTDSYLAATKLDWKNMLRGTAKFAFGQTSRLRLSYQVALQEMCRRADATICSTEEQKQHILPFCQNAHTILDLQGDIVRGYKDDYSTENVFHFVWAGLGVNLRHLLEIRDVMKRFRTKRPYKIHAITELQYKRFLNGRLGKRNTSDEAREILPEICLYSWSDRTVAAIVRSCDLALIPIPLDDPLLAGKPENRLLLFWRMGMPVLASATPAHTRVMNQCGVNMACSTQQEWHDALEYYTSDETARKRAGQCGRTFAESVHSEEKVLALWDKALHSVVE
jgi:hypothetical protein